MTIEKLLIDFGVMFISIFLAPLLIAATSILLNKTIESKWFPLVGILVISIWIPLIAIMFSIK